MNTPASTDCDILIIGGGISGLVTAHALRREGLDVQLLEAGPGPGGNMRTMRAEGWLVEAGPNSTLENDPALTGLIDELGLRPRVREADPVSAKRFVVKRGEVIALPTSPAALLSNPLFSYKDVMRLAGEPFIGRADREETIAEFVRRRLGQGFLDWAIDPFVSGVYAGDPDRLSVRAATPKIHALEVEYGSLIHGAFKRMRQKRKAGQQAPEGLQTMPSGRMISFDDGMGVLPETLAESLGEAFLPNRTVQALHHDSTTGQWRVTTGTGETFTAGQVVLSTPADVTARLLEPLDPELARLLREIVYPPVASVALGFREAQVEHPLDGFGMLIPSREGRRTLGALFSSSLFDGRAPDGHVLLTAFIGGRRQPDTVEGDDGVVVERVMKDLSALLGILGDPVRTRVTRWPRAIPQYELGHLERLEQIDRHLADLPGLSCRANWRDGISVADCVRNARAHAGKLAGQAARDKG
ncbi:MAG: protoporphyrinogen oxidase [Halothiobacillaceae bacterium]